MPRLTLLVLLINKTYIFHIPWVACKGIKTERETYKKKKKENQWTTTLHEGCIPCMERHYNHRNLHRHHQHHSQCGAASGALESAAVIIMKHNNPRLQHLARKKGGVAACATPKHTKCRAHTKNPLFGSLSLLLSFSLLSAMRETQKRSSTNFHFFACTHTGAHTHRERKQRQARQEKGDGIEGGVGFWGAVMRHFIYSRLVQCAKKQTTHMYKP